MGHRLQTGTNNMAHNSFITIKNQIILMKTKIIVLALLTGSLAVRAQQKSAADSLMNSMNANEKPVPVAIFKSTRLVLSQTTELVKKKEFKFQNN